LIVLNRRIADKTSQKSARSFAIQYAIFMRFLRFAIGYVWRFAPRSSPSENNRAHKIEPRFAAAAPNNPVKAGTPTNLPRPCQAKNIFNAPYKTGVNYTYIDIRDRRFATIG
jgi:hypothetical protein